MISDVITVSSWDIRYERVHREINKVVAYREMSPRDALHLRLLAEEMMGMIHSIAGDVDIQFWMEAMPGDCALRLRFLSRLGPDKLKKLYSISKTGKRESARGLGGRLRAFLDWCFREDTALFDDPLMMTNVLENTGNWEWDLRRFERALSAQAKADSNALRTWDELEMSVLAKLPDDVKLFIRGGFVEVVVFQKLNG